MGGSDADVGDMDIPDSDVDLDMDASELDADTDMDLGNDFDATPPFHFFTVRNFIAFFTLFGWAGIAAWDNGMSKTWTIVIAIAAGLVAMLVVASLFYFISKLVDSGGAMNYRNAINKVGNVYIPITANSGNIGKIQINIQGSLRECQAITRGNEDLKTGSVVKVVGVTSNDILIVQKHI